MAEYDEKTGFYIDEEESEKEVNKQADSKLQDRVSTEKEDFKEEKVPKLNKKVIMICLLCVGLLLCTIRLFKPGEKSKKNTQEKKQATNLIMPDFGDYQSRAYRGDEETLSPSTEIDTTLSIPSKYDAIEKTQTVPLTHQQPRPNSTQSVNKSSSVLTEEELAARAAPLAAEVFFNKKDTTNRYQTSVPQLTSPVMNQAEYAQNRLDSILALGNLSGTNTPANQSSYITQNMQSSKQSFYEQDKESYSSGYYIPEGTIWTGTVIPAVLLTGINTDTPGQIKAQVTENVYDSQTGQVLLIPSGSFLVAEYNSHISYSQSRVQIAWNTLIRPDGYIQPLGNMVGVDDEGSSGVKGHVDDHLFEYFKAMGIISLFTAINGEFDNQLKQLSNDYAANLLQQNQGVVNQLGSKLIDRAIDVQPTILVKNGTKVNVFVNKNIALPPFTKN